MNPLHVRKLFQIPSDDVMQFLEKRAGAVAHSPVGLFGLACEASAVDDLAGGRAGEDVASTTLDRAGGSKQR